VNRSPLYYPMHRGLDGDAGGAAELQTDVMRFMAILSLCLVAIFALVQSIPLVQQAAPPPDEPARPTASTPIAEERQAPPVQAAPLTRATVAPDASPVRRPATPAPVVPKSALPRPAAAAVSRPTPPPAPPSPAPTPEKVGFTLRFESDYALTRLVETGDIGVYAIYDKTALRLAIGANTPSFWPASLPNRFHEMDESTVPTAVATALYREGRSRDGLRWGVTLPATMSSELNSFVAAHSGGDLVIDAGGKLRLE